MKLYRLIRDVKTHIFYDSYIENSLLKKDEVVILISEKKEYSEYYSLTFHTCEFLHNNTIHIVNCRSGHHTNFVVEEAWQNKHFIKDFENEEQYYWENTFQEI